MHYAEMMINTFNKETQQNIRDPVRSFFHTSKVILNSTSYITNKKFKSGGILTATTENITVHAMSTGQDPKGRWNWCQISTKDRPIVFLNAYMPHSDYFSEGTATYSKQLWYTRGLTSDKFKPKTEAWMDLEKNINKLSENNSIVISFDSNIDFDAVFPC